MPLVRITLFKGRSAPELRAIADGIHKALVATFSVPEDDRFQVVEQVDPGSIIYNDSYLRIERSDGIVLVQITASNWRETEAKQALFKAIADNLANKPGVRQEDVQIILAPNEKADWSFGNGLAPYVTAASDAEARA